MPGIVREGRRSDDSGFSLVEAVVALSVIGIVAAGTGVEVVSALQTTSLSRTTLVASDLLAEQVEQARALPYDRLAMSSADVAAGADARLASASGALTADVGGGVTEPVYAAANGALTPHLLSGPATLRAGTQFTVARYVTTVAADPVTHRPCQCRRVTVFATWALGARRHARSTSTVVSGALRGGAPSWTWSVTPPATGATTTATGVLAPLEIVNSGVTDMWALTATTPSGWPVRWYRDTNGNGVIDPGETAIDAATPGTATTGSLRADQVATFVAQVAVPPGVSSGDYSLRFVATPADAVTAAQRVDLVVTV